MPKDVVGGNRYDQGNRNVARVALIFLVVMIAVNLCLFVWDTRNGHSISPAVFAALICAMAPLIVSMRPRWELRPDALVDLRKKTQISYDSIEGVRVVKSRKNGAKVFAIQADGKTHTLDVLQGEAFAREMGAKIGRMKLAGA